MARTEDDHTVKSVSRYRDAICESAHRVWTGVGTESGLKVATLEASRIHLTSAIKECLLLVMDAVERLRLSLSHSTVEGFSVELFVHPVLAMWLDKLRVQQQLHMSTSSRCSDKRVPVARSECRFDSRAVESDDCRVCQMETDPPVLARCFAPSSRVDALDCHCTIPVTSARKRASVMSPISRSCHVSAPSTYLTAAESLPETSDASGRSPRTWGSRWTASNVWSPRRAFLTGVKMHLLPRLLSRPSRASWPGLVPRRGLVRGRWLAAVLSLVAAAAASARPVCARVGTTSWEVAARCRSSASTRTSARWHKCSQPPSQLQQTRQGTTWVHTHIYTHMSIYRSIDRYACRTLRLGVVSHLHNVPGRGRSTCGSGDGSGGC